MAPLSRASVCYATPKHLCVHLITERGRPRYSIDDGSGAVIGRDLHFTRLETYIFQSEYLLRRHSFPAFPCAPDSLLTN